MNKQIEIEDMAKDIRFNMQIKPNPKEHPSLQLARLLVQDGYRKSYAVAREIFEEIEKNIFKYRSPYGETNRNTVVLTEKKFYELKKKYESEGADDE